MTTNARLALTALAIGAVLSSSAPFDGRSAPEPEARLAADSAYVVNIERAALANEDFRRVLFTGPYMQLVLMTLRPGEEIGMEVHENGDQFIRVETGTGTAVLDGASHPLEDGTIVLIPAGVDHNIVNTGNAPLRMYVLYSPPEHPDGTVHRTKQEADTAGHNH